MKKKILVAASIIASLNMSACSSGISQQDYESVAAEATQLSQEITSLKEKNTALEGERDSAKSKYESLSADFDTYKKSMSAYEGLSVAEAQAKQIEAEALIASKAAEEEAAAAAAAAQKEAEEKAGYETGITYDQLARTPDEYMHKKVKFTGIVLQVMEGSGESNQIRLAVNSDYDRVLYCEYDKSIVSSRILDNDKITIYGTSLGLYSYTSTLGAPITIPAVLIDKINQ